MIEYNYFIAIKKRGNYLFRHVLPGFHIVHIHKHLIVIWISLRV